MILNLKQCLFVVGIFFLSSAAASAQLTAIGAVQGDTGRSPMLDKQVTVRGIFTARSKNGIFIQTPDAEADKDAATSEGIFVYLGQNDSFSGDIGDLVEVRATVQEFMPRAEHYGFTITELGKANIKTILSKNPLPAPIVLTTNDLLPNRVDMLERYEGMRVKVDTLIVVGPTGGRSDDKTGIATSDGAFFGVLPNVARPVREPGVDFFIYMANKMASTVPYFDTNPEMLRVDTDAQVGAKPIDVTAGATVKNLTGVMDYSFRRYTLLADASNPPTVEGNKTFVKTSPAGERELTIGSFNIENFFDDESNSSNVNKENVETKEAFQRKLNKASLAIRNVLSMPDLLGVEEVENLAALKKLAAKINADAVVDGKPDPKYEAYLEDGNDPRGIDSGFLVKSTKLKVLETKQLGKDVKLDFENAGGASSDSSLFDRPPFLIRVHVIDAKSEAPLAVTAIVNHLKSYLGIDSEKDGPRVRQKRKQEADWLANFIVERQKANPDEKLLVCGDFNAFLYPDGYNDLIGTLRGKPDQTVLAAGKVYATGLFDLANSVKELANRYSYVHDGSTQVLDHILINGKLADRILKFGFARLDADFPAVYANDPTRPERVSDHDVPVAFFSLDPPAPRVPPMTPKSTVSN